MASPKPNCTVMASPPGGVGRPKGSAGLVRRAVAASGVYPFDFNSLNKLGYTARRRRASSLRSRSGRLVSAVDRKSSIKMAWSSKESATEFISPKSSGIVYSTTASTSPKGSSDKKFGGFCGTLPNRSPSIQTRYRNLEHGRESI